ncbi:MAG: diacylglycerol kinase family lipid kinase [Gemmatimonadota bacterium]|nr:diacylglycerol kinase family lipid kinase [Gemmatimonadota bacterium]
MMVIANPRAGRGRGLRNLERLREAIRRRGVDLDVVETHRPGHATEVAREAAERGDPRIAVLGGDGTISEVVNGLLESETALGILPMGTGNDVARSLAIPRDLDRAIDLAVHGQPRAIDVGRERDRAFVSVLGVGFPSIVAAEANSIGWLRGSPAFFVAVYKALHRLRAIPFRIELDGEVMEMRCVAVLIQNTPYTGGGLQMAPEAVVDDGILDVVIVEEIGRLDLMVNFPRVYRGGHFAHPSFTAHTAREVRVESGEELTKMFDGDLCGTTPVEAEVVPGGVNLVLPPPRGVGGRWTV